jgi:subtilisin family serine protease
VDIYTYRNPYFLTIFAAGNDGAKGATTVDNPGLSKNSITVGATVTGTPGTLAYFSSKGPTADGRYGIDVLAPGYPIISASASSTTATCNTVSMSGTSMATPATGILLNIYYILIYE